MSLKQRKNQEKNHTNAKTLRIDDKGLSINEYYDEEENCFLQIHEDEDGMHLITVDLEMDIYYEWIIEPGNKLGKLVVGSPSDVIELE